MTYPGRFGVRRCPAPSRRSTGGRPDFHAKNEERTHNFLRRPLGSATKVWQRTDASKSRFCHEQCTVIRRLLCSAKDSRRWS